MKCRRSHGIVIHDDMSSQELAIHAVRVLPLYGTAQMFESLQEAVIFIKKQPETGRCATKPLVRIEVTVRYKDGTYIEGGFPNSIRALEFLKNKQAGIL